MKKSMKFATLLLMPFMLTGCGEGWDMVRVDNMVPYGNSRTAGTGVAYVRAKMLPKKELNLVPVAREHTPKAMMKEVERVFQDAQRK